MTLSEGSHTDLREPMELGWACTMKLLTHSPAYIPCLEESSQATSLRRQRVSLPEMLAPVRAWALLRAWLLAWVQVLQLQLQLELAQVSQLESLQALVQVSQLELLLALVQVLQLELLLA